AARAAWAFGAPWTTQTDATGNFRFDDLASGRYDFVAQHGAARDVDIAQGAPVKIVLEKSETATIFGRVSGAANGRIMVTASADAEQTQSAAADSGGNFRMLNAPAGKIEVQAFLVNGERLEKSAAVSIDAKAGSE